ncbi:cyclodeaminase/cyclohydrolase family protein [Citricoccus nitrophenolicus]|uniref:Cyclodeaminase/cyclohydrolase family protein n=1 Tax=Citricoccus nitrophenolicus TaxID=863575 RepID=A0ABV0IKR9_9MICC
MIRHETIQDYVERLASGKPTPGGGATGALLLAQGSGLLAMAARFSDHEDLARRAATLATHALSVSDDDEQAFAEVAEAFGLPQDTDAQERERSKRIQEQTAAAAGPPRALVAASREALDLAERVLEDCNSTVLSDVGAGTSAVRGTLMAAALTLETDLTPLKDDQARTRIRRDIEDAEALIQRADGIVNRVRERIQQ